MIPAVADLQLDQVKKLKLTSRAPFYLNVFSVSRTDRYFIGHVLRALQEIETEGPYEEKIKWWSSKLTITFMLKNQEKITVVFDDGRLKQGEEWLDVSNEGYLADMVLEASRQFSGGREW